MFKTRYVRESYDLSIEVIRKGCLSRKKWYIKVGPRGGASPCKHLLSTPSPPPTGHYPTFEQLGQDDRVRCVTYQIGIRQPKPCDINPCKHGGTCMNVGNSFKCLCPKGYTGGTCAQGKWIHHYCSNDIAINLATGKLVQIGPYSKRITRN